MSTGPDGRMSKSEGAKNGRAQIESERVRDARIILVCDDDEEDQMLVADAFRQAGIFNPLRFVRDGEELMGYLRRREELPALPGGTRTALLLLDLNMPRKDGREALREIKGDPRLRSIPVVVLTTSDTQEDVDLVYALGGNSFISKPVTFDGLVSSMKILGHYWFQVAKLPGSSR